jgi:hypothetical protein
LRGRLRRWVGTQRFADTEIPCRGATWLRRYAGRDLRGLMEDGGWKSINSVVRYAHVVPGETATAVKKLPSVQNPCTTKRGPTKPLKSQKKTA